MDKRVLKNEMIALLCALAGWVAVTYLFPCLEVMRISGMIYIVTFQALRVAFCGTDWKFAVKCAAALLILTVHAGCLLLYGIPMERIPLCIASVVFPTAIELLIRRGARN